MNKDLKDRIIDISYKHKLSHIGSCLTAVDIIEFIYSVKREKDRFVLGQGHAGLALFCVIEKYKGINAEHILNHHGIHPDKCKICDLECSSGSLGHGIPIAIGMAMADKTRNVYVLESDGSMMEGSNMEALRIASELRLPNLHIYINVNGNTAYKEIDISRFKRIISSFEFDGYPFMYIIDTNVNDCPEWLHGLNGHYVVMDEEKYKEIKHEKRIC